MAKSSKSIVQPPGSPHPFRRAVLRGLGVLLPPLLTIVIFVWIGNTVANYLLVPLETGARHALVYSTADIRNGEDVDLSKVKDNQLTFDGETFQQVEEGTFIPQSVYATVNKKFPGKEMPATANDVYSEYVSVTYLKRWVVVPIFLLFFILTLYMLGKFLAAGVGKFFFGQFERIIHRIPLIRNVYSSVKQITDFLFSEREIEYTRVIAVEYPRKGIWTMGMVTGESLLDIRSAANEPVLSILVPTSPMPFTGFTVTVKKSETLDLDITIDQAFQFIVSCGVVVPPHQMAEALAKREEEKAAEETNTLENKPLSASDDASAKTTDDE